MKQVQAATSAVMLAIMVSGCGTAAFDAPVWTASRQSNVNPVSVGTYLQENIAKYDAMISSIEKGKNWTEFPIIPAAVLGTTVVALGGSKDVPIIAAGAGSFLGSTSRFIGPRERMGYVIQARGATTCINREYLNQVDLAQAVELLEPATAGGSAIDKAKNAVDLVPSGDMTNYPLLRPQVVGVGRIAIAASDDVVTRLKGRLAALGSAPDYAGIVDGLQQQINKAKEVSDASVALTSKQKKAAIAGSHDEAIADARARAIPELSGYSARIAECLTKIQ